MLFGYFLFFASGRFKRVSESDAGDGSNREREREGGRRGGKSPGCFRRRERFSRSLSFHVAAGCLWPNREFLEREGEKKPQKQNKRSRIINRDGL